MNDHHLEQLAHFPTREKNTLDLITASSLTSSHALPNKGKEHIGLDNGQFFDIQSRGTNLSDHDIVSGTLKVVIPQNLKKKTPPLSEG